RLKLRSYDLVACNSEYTRRWAERHGTGGLPTRVVYPPVEVDRYRPAATKRPIILSVGRFFAGRHEKRQDGMIRCFEDVVRSGVEGWELDLLGSLREYESADVAYFRELERIASGLAVVFHVDASLETARELYGQASVYWHATGHGRDSEREPQRFEHFGMSV